MKAPLPPNEAQRLETLRGYDIVDTPTEPAFEDLTLLAAQICQVPIAVISLVDENRQWFKSIIGLNATETPRDVAFCAHAILYSDEVLEVRDAQLDPRFADNPLVTADPHIRFYAGAPLVAPGGVALGTLCVIDRVPRALSAEQKTALRALSRTVIAQLELRRILAAHHRAEEQLQSLNASLEQKVEARTADLRREQENLALAIKSSNTGLWDWNMLTNEVYYSPEWKAQLGYLPDELPNNFSTWESLIHPDDLEPTMQKMQVFLASAQESYENEFRLRHRDGSYHWILARGNKRCDKNGKPIRLSGSHIDVSERKITEQMLRIAATAFDSHESMMITDADRVILRVNKAFTEDSGYTAEEVVGQTPRLLKSGRHNAEFYHAMWETIRRTGTWQGEIWDRRKNGEIYPKWLTISAVKGDDGVVTHYVGSHIDITEHKASEEKIQYLAFYDSLTRLPNRRLLMNRLQQALVSIARSDREGALLFIDLDNFKTLNDTLGHEIGDLLLQQAAQRLESCVREGDTVARLGGDEFVVMLIDLSEQPIEAAAQTEAIGEKILATLSQPYQFDKYEHHSTASIGATLLKGNQKSIDEPMKQADIAMYQAKKAGRNTLRFFDPKMQDTINARSALEGELRKALEKGQFRLYYQIQVDSSNRPLGAEALIRWMHPERGLVSPAQFIPLAEETGLILPIGQWVLETACAQLKAWENDTLTRDLTLAVNVSAKQFHQADFIAQVQRALLKSSARPTILKLEGSETALSHLKLELTESIVLENIGDTIGKMHEIKALGVNFSMDDFGTGYSSLQYLKRLPLDQLKIDQSFVRDIATDSNDRAIVRTIIVMAQSLNMGVIAEGVETEEQRQLLISKGCTHFQGYLFGRPVPIEQFNALLK
ncbi:MAG: EAL domain-containing protein [Sulfuricella sp.]|nr:EAL domain-containing protein [Sulfuricella sp.]